MKQFIVLAASLIAIFPLMSVARVSAHREKNESFQAAKIRTKGSVLFEGQEENLWGKDPESQAKALKSMNIKDIPDVGSYPDLENQFKFVRDTRFLQTDDPNFPRRLTWLYPDDGCFARAELAAENLIKNHFPSPKKVFAFGELSVDTKNSPAGSVHWWYHVAVIYRVGSQPYVLDPAINPKQPMKISEWDAAIGGTHTKVNYAICSKDTFDPDQECLNPSPMSEATAESEQRNYLPDEW
ncbi:MAG: hypothetical protein J7501_07985, partial [Bdellovibrio sp.]|nr:hypothetical protein [Bdellovibrio sp.]